MHRNSHLFPISLSIVNFSLPHAKITNGKLSC